LKGEQEKGENGARNDVGGELDPTKDKKEVRGLPGERRGNNKRSKGRKKKSDIFAGTIDHRVGWKGGKKKTRNSEGKVCTNPQV